MRSWLLVLTLACGPGGGDEPRNDEGSETAAGTNESAEAPPAGERESVAQAGEPDELPSERAGESVADRDPTPEAADPPPTTDPPNGTPTVFTRVSFDLRGMPHRGPRDVDPEMIRSRTEYLMQQMRDAAGQPEPRLTYQPGVSVFRAEFYGSESDALAQCRRAVQQVAPPVDTTRLSPRAALREPRATPCAPIR